MDSFKLTALIFILMLSISTIIPSTSGSCPIDALKLGACVDVLGNTVQIGDQKAECCPIVAGLVGVAAAECLCTAIKAKLLGLNLYLPLALNVLAACGSSVPANYSCP